ncbi:hypothetical protein [Maricaulis sp.]|uniref:hypothetical protein n=1 Tax=Maricaulis sp. TaxID=1486257 RepID=UPI003A9527E1
MMQLIVPLAGPDFIRPDGAVKACQLLDGEPLLRRALDSRVWADDVGRLAPIFVLPDHPVARAFAAGELEEWYPGSAKVFLSSYARGAAMSSLAALALTVDWSVPVCIDLSDILFDCPENPLDRFASEDVGGVALCFKSSNPAYSYLQCDEDGKVLNAAEKKVLSSNASAGVYFFRNSATLVSAIGHSMANSDTLAYKGNLFVCPLFNGVIDTGARVEINFVRDVVDVKLDA